MIKWCCFLASLILTTASFSQSYSIDSIPKRGSYLYYGQPAFEDNSFLLEEAINQEKGVMQYVSNFYFDNLRGGNFLYSFNHEIPLGGERHQLSYNLFYYFQNSSTSEPRGGGFGDINVSYRYKLSGKKAWIMVVPNFTVIIPTGKNGYGYGGLGGQFNLLMTKRISRKIVTHYNIGYTFISQADLYVSRLSSAPIVGIEKDLQYKNVGASVIWYPTRKFNVLMEYVSNFLKDLETDGTIKNRNQLTLNPGFRFAIDLNNVQIVPGMSTPFIFTNGSFDKVGVFFYLSIEPQYLPFSKAKSR